MFDVNTTNITNIQDVVKFHGWGLLEQGLILSNNLLVVVLGLFGNVMVLIGSIRCNALHMDTVSVKLVEQLAVSDIIITLIFYLPILTVITSKRWVLGNSLCAFIGFFQYVPFLMEIAIIVMISAHRLSLMRRPLSQNLKKEHIKFITPVAWLLFLAVILVLVLAGDYAYFDPNELLCRASHYERLEMRIYTMFLTLMFVICPILVILVCNVWILYLATEAQNMTLPSRKALLTICLVCWTFMLSYVPTVVEIMLQVGRQELPAWFEMFHSFILGINVIANPVIYTVTQRSFKRYMLSMLGFKKCRAAIISGTESSM